MSAKFRSATRPRGALMKQLPLSESVNAFNLIERVNSGEVVVAPPKTDPKGAIKLSDLEEKIPKQTPSNGIAAAAQKNKWLKYIPLIILLLLAIFILLFFLSVLGLLVLAVSAVALIAAYIVLDKWSKAATTNTEEATLQEQQTPDAVATYPNSPNFVITEPSARFNPAKGVTDSEEAKKFKEALAETFKVVNIKFKEPVRERLNLQELDTVITTSLNPVYTIPKRTLSFIKLPARIKENIVETFTPVMAYPEIDVPMYKPLAAISSELFLPNLNKIEQNSITLLENNQKFIESYMVGINHEMSRELLWREYPTDQRGTYFRQFWDVSSFLSVQPEPPNLKESLRDIPPIHLWSKLKSGKLFPAVPDSPKINELGAHNQRALSSGKTQLVLVIRGELLKKYPTAVIYAQKADWGKKNDVKDINEERVLLELTPAELNNPPTSKLKTPLFEAKIDPDIYFFGFDLDDEEARGTLNPTTTADDPGWFFVIKERPGEPRFGLDIEKAKDKNGAERIINWNNLSWKNIETADGSCIELDRTITFNTYQATDEENVVITDDVQARWSPDTNAAELAYILYQVPVMVAVHASRMLPK